MQRCGWLRKQTLHPPKLVVPLAANPFTRWSTRLPKWAELENRLTPVRVGLEGCHSAFNATNSIRTCLYFQTSAPPTFLTATSWSSIEHVQLRDAPVLNAAAAVCEGADTGSEASSVSRAPVSEPSGASGSLRASPVSDAVSPFDGIALFGEQAFFCSTSEEHTRREGGASMPVESPMVAIENYAERAQSVLHTRLPSAHRTNGEALRLVVGHENWGVRRSLLQARNEGEAQGRCCSTSPSSCSSAPPVADLVVYVPQYGTISSLNVVASLGIALFYCYLDAAHPGARVIYNPAGADSVAEGSADDSSSELSPASAAELQLRRSLDDYQTFFAKSLPSPANAGSGAAADAAAHVNSTPRVDSRPLHPVFYRHTMEEIHERQRAYREALLRYSGADAFALEPTGGVREQSTAQTSSVKPPSFFGVSVLYENVHDQRNFGGLIRNANAFLVDHILYVGRRKVNVVGAVGSYHYTPPHHLGYLPDEEAATTTQHAAEHEEWAAGIREKAAALYVTHVPRNWWMLDCGHDFLYTTALSGTFADSSVAASHPASLAMYRRMKSEGRVRCLCEREDELREAASGGLVLLIPQESRLPHTALQRLCTGILTVLPDGAHHAEHLCGDDAGVQGGGHRGLPSQVASGIALQRLSAVLHPRLAAL